MAKRKTKITLANHLPELLLGLGVSLVVISLIHNIIRIRALRLDKTLVQEYLSTPTIQSLVKNYPTHLSIPWYVDVDIEPQIYEDGVWTVSPNSASYLTASAQPGESGNIIIYGHNKRNILGNIRALKGYEKITLTMTDGKTKIYRVQSLNQVSPLDTNLLNPTPEETLTLYTCAGFMDSERFVVRAVPDSE